MTYQHQNIMWSTDTPKRVMCQCLIWVHTRGCMCVPWVYTEILMVTWPGHSHNSVRILLIKTKKKRRKKRRSFLPATISTVHRSVLGLQISFSPHCSACLRFDVRSATGTHQKISCPHSSLFSHLSHPLWWWQPIVPLLPAPFSVLWYFLFNSKTNE